MPSFTVRSTSPAGLYLPYYMTTASGGVNSAIQGNGAIAGANVLYNCVGYSQGRMAEIYNEINGTSGQNPFTMFNQDAQNWLAIAQNNNIPTGMTPEVGAVGVYYDGGTLGHVCNLERYVNGVWEISESHYYYDGNQNVNGSWDYSYLIGDKPRFIAYDPSWLFLGYIYPFSGLTPVVYGKGFGGVVNKLSKRKKRGITIIL